MTSSSDDLTPLLSKVSLSSSAYGTVPAPTTSSSSKKQAKEAKLQAAGKIIELMKETKSVSSEIEELNGKLSDVDWMVDKQSCANTAMWESRVAELESQKHIFWSEIASLTSKAWLERKGDSETEEKCWDLSRIS